MPDEVTLAIATALANKGAETLLAEGRGALAALFRLVKRRFAREPGGGDSEASRALAAVEVEPGDARSQAELAACLAALMARDADFDAAVRVHWRAVAEEISADCGGVVNQFSGRADKVVQARDVRGDINF